MSHPRGIRERAERLEAVRNGGESVTDKEKDDASTWVDAVRETHPPEGTIVLAIYVRDGMVTLEHEVNEFPNADIQVALRLVNKLLNGIMEKAAANAPE